MTLKHLEKKWFYNNTSGNKRDKSDQEDKDGFFNSDDRGEILSYNLEGDPIYSDGSIGTGEGRIGKGSTLLGGTSGNSGTSISPKDLADIVSAGKEQIVADGDIRENAEDELNEQQKLDDFIDGLLNSGDPKLEQEGRDLIAQIEQNGADDLPPSLVMSLPSVGADGSWDLGTVGQILGEIKGIYDKVFGSDDSVSPSVTQQIGDQKVSLPEGVVPLVGEPIEVINGGSPAQQKNANRPAPTVEINTDDPRRPDETGGGKGDAPTAEEQVQIAEIQQTLGVDPDSPINDSPSIQDNVQDAIDQETDAETKKDLQEYLDDLANSEATNLDDSVQDSIGDGVQSESEGEGEGLGIPLVFDLSSPDVYGNAPVRLPDSI